MEQTARITVAPNGPLVVTGDLPVYRRRMVESEHGEPLAWETTERLESTGGRTLLCRCGHSARKPYCDFAHAKAGFVADDVADSTYADRANVLGGTGITVSDDRTICVHAGFCGTRITNVWKEVGNTAESTVRLQVINMVEHCPSGALTYRFDGDGDGDSAERADIEPLLPAAIAVTDDGPLWVTGGVDVAIADGEPLETRNRVTLCRCGASANKPLCDGNHKHVSFNDR